MIIPPKALFCLNVNTTLNKWKVTAKWKATENKKEFSSTYLKFVGVVEEKRERKKVQHFRSLSATVYTKLVFFFCVNLARNPLKVSFFF